MISVPELRAIDGSGLTSARSARATVQAALRQRPAPSHGAELHLAAAEAERRLGHGVSALRHIRDSQILADSVGDRATSAWAGWSEANLLRQGGDLAAASAKLVDVIRTASEVGDSQLSAYARAGLAEGLRLAGDYNMARAAHLELLNESRINEDWRAVTWALEGLGQMAKNDGDLVLGGRLFEAALKLSSAVNDRRGRAYALKGLGEVRSLSGWPAQFSGQLVEEAIAIFVVLGMEPSVAWTTKTLGECLARQGQFARSQHCLERAMAMFEALGDPRGCGYVQLAWGDLHAARGRSLDARASYVRCAESLGAQGLRYGSDKALTALGYPSQHVISPAGTPSRSLVASWPSEAAGGVR